MPAEPDARHIRRAEEARLVARCLTGDALAWEELVRAHGPRVYNLCLRFTGRVPEAEDMTQEVFLRVWGSLASYRSEAGSFAGWVTTLTRHLLIDHYRRNRNERQNVNLDLAGAIPIAARAADGLVWQKEMEEQIQRALVELSPELREAVILRDLQELDYGEIADILEVPLGTVKSRINRGRVQLARWLRPAPPPLRAKV